MEPPAGVPLDGFESIVLDVVRGLLAEADPGRAARDVKPDASLTRDLGLGSLERVELVVRLEQASGLQLPETLLAEAETPRELARCLHHAAATAGVMAAPRERAAPAAPVASGASRDARAAAGAQTMVEALRWHAERSPDRVHIFLREDAGTEQPITYGALWTEATRVAAGLRDRGVVPGERVALLLRTELAFFQAYFGILLAGGVPVPLYPPFRADQIEDYARRQAGILKNADVRLLLTFAQAERAAGLLRPLAPSLAHVVTVDAVRSNHAFARLPSHDSGDLALIQYTSGSTGAPKGVALSHANLLANVRAFGEAFSIGPEDVGVSWLPLYHDMGLIGAWFGGLYHGTPVVIMSPLSFLSKPVRWLEAFHAHRGTLAAAPNFAYDLCVRKITDRELEGLDLGSWRCALNGAEAVMAGTIDRFTARFAPYGFRREAMKPVYGLAEASLCVTAPPPGRPPRVDRVAREGFERHRAITPASADEPNPMTFVACGRPLAGHDVRCVDERGVRVPDRVEGRVEFTGPSAMQGYFHNPEATAAVRRADGWIDTGDLGYQADGDLFITGRAKDVIIAGGRNIYPQEVEEAVGELSGIRRGCVAAFGLADPATGTERLVVVAESRERHGAIVDTLRAGVTASVVDAIGVPPDIVVIAPPGSVPKTSSGKIRRAATRDLFVSGRLEAGRAATWLQWARLIAADAAWRLRRAASTLGTLLFSIYAWLLVALAIPVLWILIAWTRTPRAARRTLGGFSRLALRAGGCRPTLAGPGAAALAAARPAMLVGNHASFLDVLLLLALLPDDVRFAAKARLASYPVLGTVLRRAGYLCIERGSRVSAEALAGTLASGESLFIFPEGTFMRAPGVMPFRLGAFSAAVEARRPVVPMALRGTRDVWPDGTWRLRPKRLTLIVGEPMTPAGEGWSESVRLRDAARGWIADQAGEAPVDRGLLHEDAAGRVDTVGH
jgi:1-acyl-sn-glycerol-3-phosphate acyltransferase